MAFRARGLDPEPGASCIVKRELKNFTASRRCELLESSVRCLREGSVEGDATARASLELY